MFYTSANMRDIIGEILAAKKEQGGVKSLYFVGCGGSLGALLGMRVFHHKTLHRHFRFGIPAILLLQILIPFGLWLYFAVIR